MPKPKNEYINAWFTEVEAEALRAKARISDMSVAGFIRYAVSSTPPVIQVELERLEEAAYERLESAALA